MEWLKKAVNWTARALGRLLFSVPFAIFGALHFINGGQLAQLVPIPGGLIWVYVSGVGLILAAASILVGRHDQVAAFLLGVLMALTALLVHLPGVTEANAIGDQAAMAQSMANMLKDISLAGAAWLYAGSLGARDAAGKEDDANAVNQPGGI